MESALFIFKRSKDIGPGWLLDRCQSLTVPVKVRLLDSEVELPMGIACRGVVVVGLPLDRAALESKSPALRQQRVFVRTLVGLAVPYLGVGYGAQLLSTAMLGEPGEPDGSLGASNMELTADGSLSPLFAGIESPVPVVRWPGPRISLPRRARLLAGSTERPDAFVLGEQAWGLLPHLEVTPPGFSDWLGDPRHSHLLAAPPGEPGGVSPEALREAVDAQAEAQRNAAYRLMDSFLSRVDLFRHDEPPIDVHRPPPGLPDVS